MFVENKNMHKKCFKCNEEKLTSEFYAHKQMKDGLINKCKDCCKKESKDSYNKNFLNNEWVEKERKRCVEKNKRLLYNTKYKLDSLFADSIYKNLSRNYKIKKPNQIHHWNYNSGFENDFVVLDIIEHKKAHKFIFRKKGEYLFSDENGNVLDTKEKHINYLKSKDVVIIREF